MSQFLKIIFPAPNVPNDFGKFIFGLRIYFCFFACGFSTIAFAQDGFHAGLFYDQFPLTLDSGRRTEAVGPLFYSEQKDSEKTWALPPFFSRYTYPGIEAREDDFLYPLFTYEYYGKEYRWQFFQLLSFAGGQNPQESEEHRFTIFPFYFQQRSPQTQDNYTALVPIYGHINGRLFRDKIFFVLFPIYSQTQKKDVVTDNYLFPFFHLRHGDGLFGWQFWPVVGNEHKDVTTKTNGFGDIETVGGHKKFFVLWPFYFKVTEGIGTENPAKSWGVLPLYVQTRSPARDSTSVIWPFFSWIDERGKQYANRSAADVQYPDHDGVHIRSALSAGGSRKLASGGCLGSRNSPAAAPNPDAERYCRPIHRSFGKRTVDVRPRCKRKRENGAPRLQ